MYINNNGIVCFQCIDCNQIRYDEEKEEYFCRQTGCKVTSGRDACDRIEYLTEE